MREKRMPRGKAGRPGRAIQFDREVKPGSILLLHDGYQGGHQDRSATVEVAGMILRKYSALGYRFVTISELLALQGK